MVEGRASIKYEVVIGLISGKTNSVIYDHEYIKMKWQEYAKEFYDKTGVYVSAVAMVSHAIYNKEWGCPALGEPCISFHCTANPEFIKDFDVYGEGVLYITKKLKKEYEQHTITITKIPAGVIYLTDKDNLED